MAVLVTRLVVRKMKVVQLLHDCLTCTIISIQLFQFAVTQIVGFVILLPIMYATEGDMLQTFVEKLKTDSSLQFNLVMSGLSFYIYNELATYTLQVTGAVTASVANTAKRVVSILGVVCLVLLFVSISQFTISHSLFSYCNRLSWFTWRQLQARP